MQKIFFKLRRFIFLSNYIRIILYFIFLSVFTIQLQSQWLDAYIPDFKVNDDNLNSYQTNSQLGVDSGGNFVIVWNDVRGLPGSSYPGKLYFQRYNKFGSPLNGNILVSNDTIGAPQISVLPDGRFILLWLKDFRANGGIQYYEFVYQRFDNVGQPIGIFRTVLDTAYTVSSTPSSLDISSDINGNFIVCWTRSHFFNSPDILYFRKFDSTGNRIGLPDSINIIPYSIENADIQMNDNGSFIIVWEDNRFSNPGKKDVFFQRYNLYGEKIGLNTKINDENNPDINQIGAQVSTDGNGYFAVTWIDSRNGQTGMYYQMFDSSGGTVNVNRKADELTAFGYAGSPKISMRKDKNFYIAWLDVRYTGKDQFYGRRFDSIGNPIGNAYMIPASSPGSSVQIPNDIYLFNDRVYSTWHDNRNAGSVNYDIYCNVRGFQNPDTVIGIVNNSEIIKDYRLYPAFPNPFNPETKIKFDIPKLSHVKITIFDILGREVTTLINEVKEPGYYESIFNGSMYSSGIYFYRFESDYYVDSKKMVLIK